MIATINLNNAVQYSSSSSSSNSHSLLSFTSSATSPQACLLNKPLAQTPCSPIITTISLNTLNDLKQKFESNPSLTSSNTRLNNNNNKQLHNNNTPLNESSISMTPPCNSTILHPTSLSSASTTTLCNGNTAKSNYAFMPSNKSNIPNSINRQSTVATNTE